MQYLCSCLALSGDSRKTCLNSLGPSQSGGKSLSAWKIGRLSALYDKRMRRKIIPHGMCTGRIVSGLVPNKIAIIMIIYLRNRSDGAEMNGRQLCKYGDEMPWDYHKLHRMRGNGRINIDYETLFLFCVACQRERRDCKGEIVAHHK